MTNLLDLSTLGFVFTEEDDDLICVNEVECSGVIVMGDAEIDGDVAVTSGDVLCGGFVVDNANQYDSDNIQVLSGYISDLSSTAAKAAWYLPFSGWVERVWTVCQGTVGAAGATLTAACATMAAPTELNVTIANSAVAGTLDDSGVASPVDTHFDANDVLSITVSSGATNAVGATVVVVLHKTQR